MIQKRTLGTLEGIIYTFFLLDLIYDIFSAVHSTGNLCCTHIHTHTRASQVVPVVKHLPAVQQTQDKGSIPGSGRSHGEGNGNPLQYSCLENPHGQRSLQSMGSQRVGHDRAGTQDTPSNTLHKKYLLPLAPRLGSVKRIM